MYKIAILGCENSHADQFLQFIIKDKEYTDIEVAGVYSDDIEAANKLKEKFGVYVAKSYDEFAGKVDGVIITARHGDNHYKYAKPYIASGIPMFIDKPVTVCEKEADEFKAELIKNNVKVSGGSVLKFPEKIQELKKIVAEKTYGKVYGGSMRAPVKMENPYGDFYFYAQHLIQMMCEVFGYYPNSVKAFRNNDVVNCTVRYDEYDVNLVYVDGNYKYFAGVTCENYGEYSKLELDGTFQQEFAEYYNILTGNEQKQTYDDFFAPVYILNAIDRSLKNGTEEQIKRG